jgi:hypothetical protein
MSLSVLRALLVLVCVAVWTHAASAYTKHRSHSREPTRLYRVQDERKRIGFIDRTGRRAFGRSFDSCGAFAEGFAPVALKTADGQRWGYISRSPSRSLLVANHAIFFPTPEQFFAVFDVFVDDKADHLNEPHIP